MSQFFDQASLVMVPSGYKDGKVYSQKPLSTDGELTFSRGSDIEATRVASNGFIEKAAVNLLLQSNSFDTTWVNTNTTETSGQAGYDGTSNAWLIDKSAASGKISQTISTSALVTFSLYAKANTLNWIAILYDGVSGGQAYFDLQNGVIGSQGAGVVNHTITAVGSGWYRITTTTISASSGISIFPADANNNVSGTSGNIYIQDAQLNYGLVAQEYQETTTTSVVSGITNDMPRLDYSGGASCPSLKLEPSRTNYATQSEYIGAWAQSATIGTDNFAVSPEGVQNASKVSASLTSATHFIQLTGGAVGNTATISLFAKADTGSYIQLANPYSGGIFANFDVATGVVGTKGASCISSDIEDYGNGWYRCIAVFDNTGFNSNIYRHYMVPSASAAFGLSWLPASDTSLFIYGHSWEAGSYSTSYIPTYGISATRTEDQSSSNDLTSFGFGNSYTVLFDMDLTEEINNVVNFEFKTSTASTSFTARNFLGNFRIYDNIAPLYPTGGISSETKKWVMKVDGTSFAMFGVSGGVAVKYPYNGLIPRNLGYLSIGASLSTIGIKKFIIFPTALSDGDCSTLIL